MIKFILCYFPLSQSLYFLFNSRRNQKYFKICKYIQKEGSKSKVKTKQTTVLYLNHTSSHVHVRFKISITASSSPLPCPQLQALWTPAIPHCTWAWYWHLYSHIIQVNPVCGQYLLPSSSLKKVSELGFNSLLNMAHLRLCHPECARSSSDLRS